MWLKGNITAVNLVKLLVKNQKISLFLHVIAVNIKLSETFVWLLEELSFHLQVMTEPKVV